METLIELLPLAAFGIAYFAFGGIYPAVTVLMIAMVLMVAWRYATKRPISGMLWASTGLALVFGAATLLLHDVRFIQWKPTIFDWAVAAAFLGSHFFGKQTFAERLLGPAMGEDSEIPQRYWKLSNLSWVVFWVLIGAANLYVAWHFSEGLWVSFKIIGSAVLTFAFMIGQALWLGRYAKPAKSGSTT